MRLLSYALAHMTSCKHASRMLSRLQEDGLGRFERWRLRLHLAACDGCTRFAAYLDTLRAAMKRYRESD